MTEIETCSEKTFFPYLFLRTRRKQFWQSYRENFDRQPENNFLKVQNWWEKYFRLRKKFWKVFAGLVDCRIDNSLKKLQHGQNESCSMAKNYEEVHISEKLFFFVKRFPCTFDKRCQILTTIGWNFSAQFKKEKKANLSLICFSKVCPMDM